MFGTKVVDLLTGKLRIWLSSINGALLVNGSPRSGVDVAAGNDVTEYDPPLNSLYIGGTGAVKVDFVDSGTVTYSAVPVGTTLWGSFSRVYATGTGATLIVGTR